MTTSSCSLGLSAGTNGITTSVLMSSNDGTAGFCAGVNGCHASFDGLVSVASTVSFW